MLSERYESTEVDRKNLLHVTLTKKLKLKKRLLLRCIHHFKSDLIKGMDHMHISVTEPS